MQEHRLLKKHAIKVIETVTFVVDSIGDLSKEEALNQALLGLVKGHLKRNVGLTEFRNLGIVLIDFICDINQRGAIEPIDSCTLTSGITSDNHIEDENQTSGNLDKIRGSSSQVISHRPPVLVAAWTKLYSNILDLVKHEEAELEASRLDTGTVRNSDMKITSDADAQVANAQGYDVGGGIDSKGLEGYGRGGSIGGGGDDNDGYCG